MDKTYKVITRKVCPQNWVSGTPVRLFGIYLYTKWTVALEGYGWTCAKCFVPTVYEKGKWCNDCIVSEAKKLVSSYKLKK